MTGIILNAALAAEVPMQETAEQYIHRILGYVEGQDAINVQRQTAARLKKAIQGLSPKQLKWRPEPTKWSIAEILAHLADSEIVGAWRMRSIIGESGVTIQPYDQDAWASAFAYQQRDAKRSLEMFRVLRENNLAMLKEISPEKWDNHGMHLERGKETLARVTEMFAGHDANHLLQVENVVKQLKAAESKPGNNNQKNKNQKNKKRKNKNQKNKKRR